jgi:hypothetical protein
MKLLLGAFSLLIKSLFFLSGHLLSELRHALLILLNDPLALKSDVSLMKLSHLTDFFFIPFYKPLNLRFKALDSLRPDLMYFLLLPLLTAYFFRSLPRILVLFQFNTQTVIDHLFGLLQL